MALPATWRTAESWRVGTPTTRSAASWGAEWGARWGATSVTGGMAFLLPSPPGDPGGARRRPGDFGERLAQQRAGHLHAVVGAGPQVVDRLEIVAEPCAG